MFRIYSFSARRKRVREQKKDENNIVKTLNLVGIRGDRSSGSDEEDDKLLSFGSQGKFERREGPGGKDVLLKRGSSHPLRLARPFISMTGKKAQLAVPHFRYSALDVPCGVGIF